MPDGYQGKGSRYHTVYAPDHPWPRKHGLIDEHVRVLELKLGRRLRPGEVVHHIDGDKTNNDPSNLAPLKRGKHTRLHIGRTPVQMELL